MDRAARNAFGAALTIAHFKAAGRAYVAFATEHPELFRLMFGPRGAESFGSALAEPPAETPWTLLSRCLDALVEDGVLAPERRPGAELAALSVVHGFASLPAEGHAAVPKGRARATAVEALLSFTVVGLCGEIAGPRRRSSRAASS